MTNLETAEKILNIVDDLSIGLEQIQTSVTASDVNHALTNSRNILSEKRAELEDVKTKVTALMSSIQTLNTRYSNLLSSIQNKYVYEALINEKSVSSIQQELERQREDKIYENTTVLVTTLAEKLGSLAESYQYGEISPDNIQKEALDLYIDGDLDSLPASDIRFYGEAFNINFDDIKTSNLQPHIDEALSELTRLKSPLQDIIAERDNLKKDTRLYNLVSNQEGEDFLAELLTLQL